MNYDELVKKLRNRRECLQTGLDLDIDYPLLREAADAIEELNEVCDHQRDILMEFGGETGIRQIAEHNHNLWQMLREKAPGWIPVEEKLPEQPGDYIVFLKSPENIRKQWLEYGFDDDGSYVATAFYNDSQRIWEMENEAYNTDLGKVDMDDDYAITHWMPKPDRPKEK